MPAYDYFSQLMDNPQHVPAPARWLLIIMVLLLSFMLGYQLYIVDDLLELQQQQRQEIALKQRFKQKHNEAYLLPFYRVQLQEIKHISTTLMKTLSKQTEIPRLLVDISKIAIANGLTIQVFEPKAEILRAFYAEKPIHFQAIGNYKQLAHFASDLAALTQVVNLHDMELKPLADNKNTQLEMQVTIKTFRYLAEEDIQP
jgi:type IV pilus assembly protein PilO